MRQEGLGVLIASPALLRGLAAAGAPGGVMVVGLLAGRAPRSEHGPASRAFGSNTTPFIPDIGNTSAGFCLSGGFWVMLGGRFLQDMRLRPQIYCFAG